MLTRVYGFAGNMAAILFLFFLGYFARPRRSKALDLLESALPFAMLLVWFLPSRAFGAAEPPKVETPPAPGPTNEPIEPK